MAKNARKKVLKSSRKKAVQTFILSMIFVLVGIWMIVSEEDQLIGWVSVLFFGLGIPVSISMFVMPTKLYLTEESFRFSSPTGKMSKFEWRDIEKFYLYEQSGITLVGIAFSPIYEKQKISRTIAQSISGGHQAALPNSLAISPEKLCKTMEQWRRAYSRQR